MRIDEVTRGDAFRRDCVLFYNVPRRAEYYYYPATLHQYYKGLYRVKIKIVRLPYISDTERHAVISNINIDRAHRQFKILDRVAGIENPNDPSTEYNINTVIHPKKEDEWKPVVGGPISKLLELIKITTV